MRPPRLARSASVGVCLAGSAILFQAAQVVDNPAPRQLPATFRLSAPIARIGGLNNDENYEILYLHGVDVTETGRLIVLPSPETSFRVFDLTGKHQRTIGRRGQGPGEFLRILRISVMRGDTVAAYDASLRRVSIFNVATGELLRTILDIKDGLCCFTDGSLLSRTIVPSPAHGATPAAPDKHVWSRVVRNGATPAARNILTTRGDDPKILVGQFLAPLLRGAGQTMAPQMATVPFARTAFIRIAGNEVVFASTDAYEYRVYSMNGDLLRTVRASVPPARPTAAQVDSARRRFMMSANTPEKRRAYEDAYNKLQRYTTLPAFGYLSTARDGSVWIQNFRGPGTDEWWAKYDRTGKLVGTLTIPSNREIAKFLPDYVLLESSDDNDQTMTLYVHRLERVGGG